MYSWLSEPQTGTAAEMVTAHSPHYPVPEIKEIPSN